MFDLFWIPVMQVTAFPFFMCMFSFGEHSTLQLVSCFTTEGKMSLMMFLDAELLVS